MMKVRALDLFHGAGGSSIGARAAGAEIVAGIDFWGIASECHKLNFPESQTINADIRSISPKELRRQIGDIDLIIASPECTSHTCARGKAERSEESRLTAFEVVRFAKVFMPRWIVVENVVHMQSWVAYPKLLHDIEKLGYHIRPMKLNAMDFGVAQSRRRLFLVCSLSDSLPDVIAVPESKPMPASSVINLNGKYSYTPLLSPGRALPTIERAKRAMAELGKDEHFLIVYYGSDRSGGWQSVNRPLRTITTLDRFAYVKPSPDGHIMRMLQPEELKLAMGFPESFRLEARVRRDRIRLMGNAVCPPVMECIVRSLISEGKT